MQQGTSASPKGSAKSVGLFSRLCLCAVWPVLSLGLAAAVGCSGGTPNDRSDMPTAGTELTWDGEGSAAAVSAEKLEEIRFKQVWDSQAYRGSRIDQAWVVNGNLYVTTPTRLDNKGRPENYRLIKIDGDTGTTAWIYDLTGKLEFAPRVFQYSKELRDSNATELTLVQNDIIYVLDDNYGADMYRLECDFPVSTSAVPSEDYIFAGSYNKRTYCFSKDKQALQWSYVTDATVSAAPEAGDLNVFFGSEDNNVYCLNKGGGFQYGKSWSKDTGGRIEVSPLFDNGKIYVGSWDYKVYCFEVFQGFLRWSYPTGAPVVGRLFLYNDYLFATSLEEKRGQNKPKLVALKRNDGVLRWERPGISRVVAADPFHAFCLNDQGQLEALRLEDGVPGWKLDVTKFKHVLTQDAERGARRDHLGRIYFATEDGYMQCIQPRR